MKPNKKTLGGNETMNIKILIAMMAIFFVAIIGQVQAEQCEQSFEQCSTAKIDDVWTYAVQTGDTYLISSKIELSGLGNSNDSELYPLHIHYYKDGIEYFNSTIEFHDGFTTMAIHGEVCERDYNKNKGIPFENIEVRLFDKNYFNNLLSWHKTYEPIYLYNLSSEPNIEISGFSLEKQDKGFLDFFSEDQYKLKVLIRNEDQYAFKGKVSLRVEYRGLSHFEGILRPQQSEWIEIESLFNEKDLQDIDFHHFWFYSCY